MSTLQPYHISPPCPPRTRSRSWSPTLSSARSLLAAVSPGASVTRAAYRPLRTGWVPTWMGPALGRSQIPPSSRPVSKSPQNQTPGRGAVLPAPWTVSATQVVRTARILARRLTDRSLVRGCAENHRPLRAPADYRKVASFSGRDKLRAFSYVALENAHPSPRRDPMTRHPLRLTAVLTVAVALGLAGSAAAQFPGVTLPPSGGNQRQTVIQQIGLVRVTVDYSSPHVHSPSGEDRKGKIWGTLVPYGMSNQGFGTCGDQCPWRGGANENTTFTTS